MSELNPIFVLKTTLMREIAEAKLALMNKSLTDSKRKIVENKMKKAQAQLNTISKK